MKDVDKNLFAKTGIIKEANAEPIVGPLSKRKMKRKQDRSQSKGGWQTYHFP